MTETQLERLKDVIQDCNLNFLLGSGLSMPYIRTLGNIETLLTEVDKSSLPAAEAQVVRCSLYKLYFDQVMLRNRSILDKDAAAEPVQAAYSGLLRTLNTILQRRKSSLLGKEINLFTTNVDIFLERSLEEIGLEFNDGFNGRFRPRFSLSNFNKSRSKRSLHFDNVSEIPVFNLIKLHGSVTWHLEDDRTMTFSATLDKVGTTAAIQIPDGSLVKVADDAKFDDLATAAKSLKVTKQMEAFITAYEDLLVVNPSKEKFKHTLLNQTYYELLRIFSNELEKDNSVLFVMGFSFADEHIREITLRAANSNPTLLVYVFAHSTESAAAIRSQLGTDIKNANINIIAPNAGPNGDDENYDLVTINRVIFQRMFPDETSNLPATPAKDS
ncbi:SIR2 family protein [Edaphobacter albus]|uniref:SIR2 family protein n=1 Tax=Edaphobacter sp. 4G125 TaxID=2763071 RepID=UPI0016494FA6|nr:SIR2 family protein [Edaphobacter sp. 4G125]QNI35866.1 SIR2 family protein [Edaphobacter sp. 4G125]